MMSKTMVKIICIVMAVLMVLSVGAVVLQVFAADEGLIPANMSVVPATGDNDGDYIIPASIAAVAILAIVVCLVAPKLKKKTAKSEEDDSAEDTADDTENDGDNDGAEE